MSRHWTIPRHSGRHPTEDPDGCVPGGQRRASGGAATILVLGYIRLVAWEIVLLEPVDTWFLKLCESDPDTAALVEQAIDRLAIAGPSLGRPLVDTLEHSSLRNLKELRPGSRGRSEIRILFVFDPGRQAILLVAGDKAGRWSRWYQEAIPLAERRYADWRASRPQEGEG
jgi:hypothetical protein